MPSGPFLNPGSGDIGGLTLIAGLYKFTSALSVTGSDVTLTGSATDIWIFQVASNLLIGSGIKVILAGGAQARIAAVTLASVTVVRPSFIAAVRLGGAAPEGFSLSQNFPNPFNPSTLIRYSLKADAQVSLKVYSLLGDHVATLIDGRQEAGTYSIPFGIMNGTMTLPSGIYFYRLDAGSYVSTRKLTIIK